MAPERDAAMVAEGPGMASSATERPDPIGPAASPSEQAALRVATNQAAPGEAVSGAGGAGEESSRHRGRPSAGRAALAQPAPGAGGGL
ncbi:hypothetical protein E2562_015079 [Oryza meyeriana var. granulata]|uniref:Uncharacterized protein n=1 Tax=Oryza meyeriana var. granulata TaxID=110450 RepID=A0A6G1DXG6_9ORYZ|nr:hypothetical protein E2562_015079 [Oryza meyeriana var. granulata]